jgi:hypothetical protein
VRQLDELSPCLGVAAHPKEWSPAPFGGFEDSRIRVAFFIVFLGRPTTVEVVLWSASGHHELTIPTAWMLANSPAGVLVRSHETCGRR